MPMANLVRDHFVAAMAQGLGEADWAAIARVSYRNASVADAGLEATIRMLRVAVTLAAQVVEGKPRFALRGPVW
jgi:hypothetical protein